MTFSWLFFFLTFLCLLKEGPAIKCYECDEMYNIKMLNVCKLGYIGERKECAPEVKNCYKSRTTESEPKIVRKCGSMKKVQNVCEEVNIGSNSQISCSCDNEDLCNSASHLSPRNFSYKIFILLCVLLVR